MNAAAPGAGESFRHEALFYSGRTEFVDGTLSFIRKGIAAGDVILVVEPRDKIDMLRSALDRDAGAVMFADMAEVGANPARIIPAWQRFVQDHGTPGRGLRGIGEPIWDGRSPDELVECQRHESLLNVAFGHGRPWSLLCPYDVENLPAEVIVEARRSHPYVVEGAGAVQSELFRGIDASGDRFGEPLPEAPDGALAFGFDADSLLALRRRTARFASGAGLSVAQTAELVTAVNEVATNSIRHGGGSGTVRLWLEGSTVLCEVSDSGLLEAPMAGRVQPTRASDARGLWLANQLCELVQVRSYPAGTTVRMHFRSRGATPSLRVLGGTTPVEDGDLRLTPTG